jgi:hypothetical protein
MEGDIDEYEGLSDTEGNSDGNSDTIFDGARESDGIFDGLIPLGSWVVLGRNEGILVGGFDGEDVGLIGAVVGWVCCKKNCCD